MREWKKIWIHLYFVHEQLSFVRVFLKYVTKTRTDYFVFGQSFLLFPFCTFSDLSLLSFPFASSALSICCHCVSYLVPSGLCFLSAHNNYIIPYPTLHYLHQYPLETPHPVPLIYHANTHTDTDTLAALVSLF